MTFASIPRISGVSRKITVLRSLVKPRPRSVSRCLRGLPIPLRLNVTTILCSVDMIDTRCVYVEKEDSSNRNLGWSSSSFLPRFLAMYSGDWSCFRPSKVAFVTL